MSFLAETNQSIFLKFRDKRKVKIERKAKDCGGGCMYLFHSHK